MGKKSLREIARITNVDKSKLSRINRFLQSNDEAALERMLSSATCKRGATTVVTAEEEKMIAERLIFAAKRGYVAGKDSLKSIMGQIASDGRPTWRNGVSCDDAIQAFRARHRELTFRNSENKDKAKIREENCSHVEGFFKALKEVERSNPGILSDADRIWNIDEKRKDNRSDKKSQKKAKKAHQKGESHKSVKGEVKI